MDVKTPYLNHFHLLEIIIPVRFILDQPE
jgi:hypothetical protein